MQSQTAFCYIGQVLTVDLCLRLARVVLNLEHPVKVVFVLQFSLVGQCNNMGLKMTVF